MPAEGSATPHAETSALVTQLRQSLGLLRVAFDATGEAMLIVDSDRHVRWVNQTAADLWGDGLPLRVIGKPLEALLRLRHLDQRLLDLSDSHHPLNQARLGEGQASLLVQAIWSPVGDQPDVLQRIVSWRPISEMGGVFTLLIFRDLEPLEKSLHQQRAFINTLAHELRTPLAILTGSLRRLDRKSQLAAPLDRVLEDAIGETKRMAALVDKLLLLSELDTDHFHWNLKRAPLQQFLDHWLRNLEPNRRSNVSLQMDESLFSCWIDLDEIAVFRILDTLLENSLLFGSEGMILHISESVSPQSVDLVVFLNGAGSSGNQDCNEVMDQSEPLEFKFVVGDGDDHNLGMSVVKNLVEGMGGLMLWSNTRKQATATGPAQMTLRFPLVNPDGEGSAVSEDVDPEAQEDAQTNQA